MDPKWCVCACMYGTEREGDDLLLLPSASYADLRRGSGGSASLSPVMEQLAGLLGSDLPPLPTMSTIRESASRQVPPPSSAWTACLSRSLPASSSFLLLSLSLPASFLLLSLSLHPPFLLLSQPASSLSLALSACLLPFSCSLSLPPPFLLISLFMALGPGMFFCCVIHILGYFCGLCG